MLVHKGVLMLSIHKRGEGLSRGSMVGRVDVHTGQRIEYFETNNMTSNDYMK